MGRLFNGWHLVASLVIATTINADDRDLEFLYDLARSIGFDRRRSGSNRLRRERQSRRNTRDGNQQVA